MTTYAFGIDSPRAFLEKARREVQRLADIEFSPGKSPLATVQEIQDAAINAAWTLWHVSDWIARSPDQKYIAAIERIRRERPSNKTVPLKIIREHIEDNSVMVLCNALANGAKHFTLTDPPRFDATRVLPQYRSGPAAGTAAVDVASTVSLSGATTMADLKTLVVPRAVAKLRINGEPLLAIDAFRDALVYWDKFFEDYKLNVDST